MTHPGWARPPRGTQRHLYTPEGGPLGYVEVWNSDSGLLSDCTLLCCTPATLSATTASHTGRQDRQGCKPVDRGASIYNREGFRGRRSGSRDSPCTAQCTGGLRSHLTAWYVPPTTDDVEVEFEVDIFSMGHLVHNVSLGGAGWGCHGERSGPLSCHTAAVAGPCARTAHTL